ncbi:hypothetical protein LTR74_007632 [Friedmanniomyces endolithicus]|nr:hypothetical protein LTR74_007632 [Friedmanniomyces endolithicus]
MSVHDLMFSLVSRMILVEKNLDILTLCTPSMRLKWDAPEKSPRALPSWVPDFEAQGLSYLASMGHLSEDSPLHSVMSLLSATAAEPNDVGGSDKDMHAVPEAQPTLNTSFGHPSNGLRQVGSTSLKVSGFHIVKVGTLSTEHRKLLPLLDQHAQRQNAYLDLPKHEKERILGIQELPYKLLYFWYPVWRALDPAYLRNGHEELGVDLIDDLTAYFADTRALEDCRKARVDLHTAIQGTATNDLKKTLHKRHDTDGDFMKSTENRLRELRSRLDIDVRAEATMQAMTGRRYFMTTHSLLGVGPESLEEGDVVIVLNRSGLHSPRMGCCLGAAWQCFCGCAASFAAVV